VRAASTTTRDLYELSCELAAQLEEVKAELCEYADEHALNGCECDEGHEGDCRLGHAIALLDSSRALLERARVLGVAP
jgi:hypothetical protein